MQALAARLGVAGRALSGCQALRRGLVTGVSDGRAFALLGLRQDQQLRGLTCLTSRPLTAVDLVVAGLPDLTFARGAAGAAAATTSTTTTVSRKRDTPKRDPERPKRPESAFLLFIQQLRQQRPEIKGPQIMKVAGVEWKALAADKRKPFEEKAAANKLIYETKMKEYVDSGKRDAWKRDPERPKQPPTPYLRFLKEFRASNPNLKMLEVTTLGAAAWKNLPAAEKAKYEKGYESEKEAHVAALKAYKESGKEKAWKDKVGITAQKDKEAQAKAKAKAKAKAAEKLSKLAEKIKAAKEKLAKAKEGLKVVKSANKGSKVVKSADKSSKVVKSANKGSKVVKSADKSSKAAK